MGMLAVGLLFKVGAVPFQAWTPDVYQGAPTAVTAFMAACTKIAAFGAMLRLFYVAFGAERWDWQPMLWIIAILTMLVGSILAVVQTDVKRMLAYSSVAHTGFLLTGAARRPGGLGARAPTRSPRCRRCCSTWRRTARPRSAPSRSSPWSATRAARRRRSRSGPGSASASPLVAGAFGFLLLSMAGIPLTGGFVGKWAVFAVALSAGAWPVVLVAIVSSIISVFFYVRVILLMFFADERRRPTAATPWRR